MQPILLFFSSLQWNESRGVSGTNTWTTVTNRFVGQREFSQVMSDHFRFDFNLVEGLPIVDTDDASDHVGKNDHVTKMGFHLEELLFWPFGVSSSKPWVSFSIHG